MSKPIDQEREAFEKEFKVPNGTHFSDGRYQYADHEIIDCIKHAEQWKGWQARASVQPAGVAVPEGWRLEETPDGAYCLSSDDGEHRHFFSERGHRPAVAISAFFKAMLAAAPHPVSGEQKTDELHSLDKQCRDDVAVLVEMLDSMVCAYRSAIATGYDRITGLGGQCDAVDHMLAAFPDYAKAKAMVAAHRAQQGEQP